MAGFAIKPWVKPSLAPGSRVVMRLEAAGLEEDCTSRLQHGWLWLYNLYRKLRTSG